MHGHGGNAELFCAPGQFGGIVRGVPSQAHLHGHRARRRAERRHHDPLGLVEIAHQGRAAQDAGHFLGRAAEIEIDDMRAGLFGQGRAARDVGWVAADQLDDLQATVVTELRFAHDVGAAALHLGASDHLGRRVRRAQFVRHVAERQVGDAGHGRDKHTARDFDIADFQTFCRHAAFHTQIDAVWKCG